MYDYNVTDLTDRRRGENLNMSSGEEVRQISRTDKGKTI